MFHIYIERTSDEIYITEHTDIPGLVLETSSLPELKRAIHEVVPELLESNVGIPFDEMENVVVQVFFPNEAIGVQKHPHVLIEECPQVLVV